MKVYGVIPARFHSTRLIGKPLVPLLGKPLLQWVIEKSLQSKKIEKILVATDHLDIMKLAEKCGVEAVMTDPELPSGSDRVWAAIQDRKCDIAINIQGDEPLISGSLLDRLIEPFEIQKDLQMATLGRELKAGDLESQTTAKIVLNHLNEALYFSRFPIPYSRLKANEKTGALKHIGLYAYKKDFLKTFCAQGPVEIEIAEGLEQLRALYLGARIAVVKVDHESWGVDTPEDIKKVEEILRREQNG
jgi:3-deoxy-manno-octulosonate cytidylyltransferase (CMP-KDO synthetase)